MERRRFLRLLGAAASMGGLSGCVTAAPRFAEDPFALGIASGSPRADGMVLWTRLMQSQTPMIAPVPVRWEIAEDEGFRRVAARGETAALPEFGHSIHVEVAGLAADRWYFYRFEAGGARSPIGRTRTLPAPDQLPSRARFALASCQRWQHGYYGAYRHMLADDPDAVLFVGDYIYEYADQPQNDVRPLGLGSQPRDLAGYRSQYARYKSDPDLQAMHGHCPWFFTWDDHEVYNDYARDQGEDLDPNFLKRKFAAYRAYYEHMPIRAASLTRGLAGLDAQAELRIYDRVAWGRLGQIHLLDDRQYRDAQACPRPGRGGSTTADPQRCAGLRDPARTLLGPQQSEWLRDGIARANGADEPAWNFLVQQTLFAPRDLRVGPGELYWTDGWDGYPAARQRLIDLIAAARPNNPVFLGGDVHEFYVAEIKREARHGDSPTIATEFCGTSITSRPAPLVNGLLAENPHIKLYDPSRRGYTLLDVTPARLEAALRVIDDPRQRNTGAATLARYAVVAGRAEILGA